ncbi:histidinol-phosphate transaminase [Nakamurella flavida]|uniref:Aromatic amino acid aminotransferase n=1 Tax=Nakamurella flavida TaxID=363630 RepID=A0A938YL11_9ACTN|nr:histidinol-phosphate transaminase [Nakamurella flavida]
MTSPATSPPATTAGLTEPGLRAPVLRAAVRALPAYVAGRRAATPGTAALAANESHHAPLPSVLRAVRDAAGALNRYPDPACVDLREALAGHLSVGADEIAVGPGSVGVLQQILTTVCDHGDEVVFAWRSFEAYPILTGIAGATGVRVPLRADESHDLAAMAAAVTDRTRVIVLCSPNNPTGTPIPAADLDAFLARVPTRVLVVLDEAYVEFVPPAGTSDVADVAEPVDALAVYRAHRNVCVLRTFSKAHGLAGLRVGYAVARPTLAAGLRSTALPFGVSALAQRAAIASLAAADEMAVRVADLDRERTRVVAVLRAAGWAVPETHANFVFLRLSDPDRLRVTRGFDDAEILVRGYPGDGVRITLGAPADNDRVVAVLTHPAVLRSHHPTDPEPTAAAAPTGTALAGSAR